jgi:predicted nucleic acid-binding protein
MKEIVWVDTSFLYALFAKSDANHVSANKTWNWYINDHKQFVTLNLIIAELGTLLLYRFGHKTALERIAMVQDSTVLRTVYSDSLIEFGVLQWWHKFNDQQFSYVDCASFECMRRLGIKKAMTFDRDYQIAGFEKIIK